MSSPKVKVAIIIYSMYGHISKLAEQMKKTIVAKGGADAAEIFQVPETLSGDILAKMHAPDPKRDSYPIATLQTLTNYNAFLFGIPTRYGNMPAQLKTFWDTTGKLWTSGSLAGKYAGVFVSTSGPGGGQETTVITFLSTLVHHGIIFVPFGYATGFMEKNSLTEVHGGSPWGAGTFSPNNDGEPEHFATQLELEIAGCQANAFYDIVSRVQF